MTITLDLQGDQELRLIKLAAAHDLAGMRDLLAEAATSVAEQLLGNDAETLTESEFDALADQFAAELSDCGAEPLSEEAMSRSGIYGACLVGCSSFNTIYQIIP